MHKAKHGIVIVLFVALTGCAAGRAGKPLLTAAASNRIAKQCGAVRSEYSRGKRDLPSATFILKADEVVPEDGLSPTVRCIGMELNSYRHAGFGFRPNSTRQN